MVGRRRVCAAGVVVLCAAASVVLGTGAEAGASRTGVGPAGSGPVAATAGLTNDQGDGVAANLQRRLREAYETLSPGTTPPVVTTGDGGHGDGAVGTESTPAEPAGGGPTVGGAPATTSGAADTEAPVAPTAPTPPKGAEPAAAGSPGAAVPSDDADVAAAPPAADTPALALPDVVDSTIGVTDPQPVANGLTPDTTGSGALVAVFAAAVLLFLIAHQFVNRRDPRLQAVSDADAVARFR